MSKTNDNGIEARAAARAAMIDLVLDGDAPGSDWVPRDAEQSAIEPNLRIEALLLRATLDLLREDVKQAREEGVSWRAIGEALDMTEGTAALAYGARLD